MYRYMAKQCDHIIFAEGDRNDADHLLPVGFRDYPNGVYIITSGRSNSLQVIFIDAYG